jgi:hypothetical protein
VASQEQKLNGMYISMFILLATGFLRSDADSNVNDGWFN